jgi:hypothetical protein
VLTATITVAALLACIRVVSNPRTQELVVTGSPPPIYSLGARRAAAIAIPFVALAGLAGICATKPAPPAGAVREFLDRLHARQAAMRKNDDNVLDVYRRYAEARRQGGRLFWDDPAVAPQAQVEFVENHNRLLAAYVDEPIVPATLTDVAWVPAKVRPDLERVLARCRAADDERMKIRELQGRAGDNHRDLNERLCRYWELVLGEPQTYLVTEGSRFKAADTNVTNALPDIEKEGASCFHGWF